MIDAFCIVLLVVFASMNALAMVDYLLRRNTLNEELALQREQLGELDHRLGAARVELEDLEFEADLLEVEQQALQAQESCMREVEETHERDAEAGRRA